MGRRAHEPMSSLLDTCPPDDRTAERKVFPGATADAVKNVIARACKTAGIAHYHPHDFRHRFASVMVAQGVPLPQVAAALGHSRKSLTLDVYSHVLMDEGKALGSVGRGAVNPQT